MAGSTHSPASSDRPGQPTGASSAADGRIERGARARDSIAEALIALLETGAIQPTATQVAEQAGVSRRLVFHHFEDMESVLKAAVSVQVKRHWKDLGPIPPDGTLRDRVMATVRRRADLYEAIAPVRRAAARAASSSPTLTEQLEFARRTLRSQLHHTFGKELSKDANEARRDDMLDALEVSTSFETWDHLRRQTGLSVHRASAVMERLAIGVVS
jgi:AcrR family transcriptional regulator